MNAAPAASSGSLPEPEVVAAAALVALDPGKRLGVAWVSAGGSLLRGAIVALEDLPRVPLPPGARVVQGDGTGSQALAAALRELGVCSERVDETGTSELGRLLYWRRHPPRGIGRLVPLGMRVPPRPIDDFAAYAIALRVLGTATVQGG